MFLSCLHKMHPPGKYIGVVHPGSGDQSFNFMGQEAIADENGKLAKKGMALSVIRRLHYNDGGLFPDLDGFQK